MLLTLDQHQDSKKSPKRTRWRRSWAIRKTNDNMCVSHWRNDQWVIHEEIPEVEETKKVERATKRLVTEVQVIFASPPGLAV